MATVLLVEDDDELSEIVGGWLSLEGYTVKISGDGDKALNELASQSFDVVIIDWKLPSISGIELCQRYRAGGGSAFILMLTGKDKIADKTAGFDAGVDDYLTKPFKAKELSARVRALLRRPKQYTGSALKARHIILDLDLHRVLKNGEEVPLISLEFALLEFFMRHQDIVFSQEELLNRVWSDTSHATIETLRTYIKTLRQKIDIEGQSSMIKTVHGVGYMLQAEDAGDG